MADIPSEEDFDVAIGWLDINEGEDGEKEACRRVAAWISEYSENRRIRTIARENGIPVGALRRRLAGR